MRQVKKFEAGMVVNPLTVTPDTTLRRGTRADAAPRHLRPAGGGGPGGRLVGILTNRDVRFVQSSERPVRELMTARAV